MKDKIIIEIDEKRVKIEPSQSTALRKYPWHKMEIGDSFTIDDSSCAASLAGTANIRFGKTKRFISRKIKENGLILRRIWRVK